jgi:hypothetical protein
MPVQEGRTDRILLSWQNTRELSFREPAQWPLTIESHLGTRHRPLAEIRPVAMAVQAQIRAYLQATLPVRLPKLNSAPEPIPAADRVVVEETPPLCARWAPSPAADPVARFVHSATVLTPTTAKPRFAAVIEMPLGARKLHVSGASPSPAAEPVAAFVSSSAALDPLPMVAARRPAAALQVPAWQKTLPVGAAAASAAAEPVAEFVRPAVALAPLALVPARRQSAAIPIPDRRNYPPLAAAVAGPSAEPVAEFVRLAAALVPQPMAPAVRFAWQPVISSAAPHTANPVPAPAADPVARFLNFSTALTPAAAAAPALRQPVPAIEAELEPLPVPDQPITPPAICLRAMPSLAAEPVCRFVEPAVYGFLSTALPHSAPRFLLDVALPYVPSVARTRRSADPEPVMSGVYPRMSELPIAPIAAAGTAVALPANLDFAQRMFALANPAPGLPAEAAESLLIAASAAVPVSPVVECRLPSTAGVALAGSEPAPALAAPATSLEPAAVESFLAASAAASEPAKAKMRVLNFKIEASEDLMAPGFETPKLAPKVAEPSRAASGIVSLRPIATLGVAVPAQTHERILPSLPHPGILPVEFHTQRSRGVLFARPEWHSSRLAPLPPRFALRPVFGKLEEPAPQPKPVRQEPEFVKTFNMSARKPSAILLLGGKIAAGVLLASSLWYAYSFRSRLKTRVEVAAVETSNASAGSAAVSVQPLESQPAAKGPVMWARQVIARRAALQVTDHFREGMQGWGASDAAKPAGWSHHPDGYTIPGALALFRPSLKFQDYRLEFFGQIESKGMSWSVRAKDPQNYHAMKVAVVEQGLRPFVALVHWDVVDGKPGRQSRTPLNIMVHNNRPMQVAVNIEGSRFVTSIDGEEVDSFTDNTLASGGVGFFSEANERARLYWMRVSRNDDFLGHVCAFLAGDDAARATASLRAPQLPGNVPAPWAPADESATFAAVWAALPYLRAAQRARVSNHRRDDQWNL